MKNDKKFAVIFDMDGTLIDNALYHKNAWMFFMAKFGIRFSEQEYYTQLFGKTSGEILDFFLPKKLSSQEKQRFSLEKEALYRQIYAAAIQPAPGLLALLDELKKAEIKMAVATSAIGENLDFVLDSLHLRAYFSVISDADCVTQHKPHPEVFLETAKKLGLAPEKCLVFEDSPFGVEAAKRAGMKVIAVNPSDKSKINKLTPWVFQDFTEIGLDKIMAIFGQD
jgi:beta-phosphoglucomutase family hydrolase